mmetsp:Transcript_77866/g.167009  ORF Transcript_77866/g.167009 Transcript_77866/m.167009 type:complete len:346 (+) Transcript_77866:1319-2356(+)
MVPFPYDEHLAYEDEHLIQYADCKDSEDQHGHHSGLRVNPRLTKFLLRRIVERRRKEGGVADDRALFRAIARDCRVLTNCLVKRGLAVKSIFVHEDRGCGISGLGRHRQGDVASARSVCADRHATRWRIQSGGEPGRRLQVQDSEAVLLGLPSFQGGRIRGHGALGASPQFHSRLGVHHTLDELQTRESLLASEFDGDPVRGGPVSGSARLGFPAITASKGAQSAVGVKVPVDLAGSDARSAPSQFVVAQRASIEASRRSVANCLPAALHDPHLRTGEGGFGRCGALGRDHEDKTDNRDQERQQCRHYTPCQVLPTIVVNVLPCEITGLWCVHDHDLRALKAQMF